MADKVTCCPHCNTSFRITDAQLASAKGAVRCGSCLQIFKALDHLVTPRQEANTSPEQPTAPAQAIPEHLESPDHSTTAENVATDELPHHEEKTAIESQYAEDDMLIDDHDDLIHDDMDDLGLGQLSDEFLDKDSAPQTHGTMFDRKIEVKSNQIHEADDSWAEALLNDAEPAPESDSKSSPESAPETEQYASDSPADEHLELSDDEETDGIETTFATGERTRSGDIKHEPRFVITDDGHLNEEDSKSEDQLNDQQLRDMHTGEDTEQTLEESDPAKHAILENIADAPVEMEYHPEDSPWPKRLLWSGLNLVALLLLAAQFAWFNYDSLSRQQPYRSVFETVCPIVGCQLPPKYDIDQIKSYNLVVRSHPKADNALAVDSILLNTAAFSQPFPKLMLVFSDLNGNPVAHRTFAAQEYLAGELAGALEMPSQTPVHIALEVLDPGAKAVNYQLAIVGH